MSAAAHEHGSLGEEAARLVDAFGQVAASWSRPAGAQAPGAGGHPASSCRVCPLCQLIARLQEVRPEVVDHLADATSSLAAAFSELAAGRREQARSRSPREDIEQIDITD